MQQAPDRRTVHFQPMPLDQFRRQFINRKVRLGANPAPYPALDAGQLATSRVPLRLWGQGTGLPFQSHHIVDELDRNAQPPRRFSVRVTLLNKRNNTGAQLNRMRLAHP